MKGNIIFILINIMFSCNLTGEIHKYSWQIPIDINTKQEALDYVKTYDYIAKKGVFTPDQFYLQGYGDCEDFALMFQYILETELNIEATLVGGTYNNRLHMWVESEGIIYEPTAGIINPYTDLYIEWYRYECPESINMVRRYGGFIPK